MRSLTIGILVWLALIAAATVYGGLMSLCTGNGAELPKWNGWFYLFFCAQQGAMFAVVLTWPIPIVVSIVAWIVSERNHVA